MTNKQIIVVETDETSCATTSSLQPIPGGVSPNLLINADMRIAQRGTSFAAPTNGDYLLDRWLIAGQLSGNVTVSQSTDVPLRTFTSSLKVVVDTAKASLASDDILRIQQKIEGYNAAPIGLGTPDAQSFTVSFWVKAPSTGTYYLTISPKTGTTQYYPASYTIDAANTWEQKTITIPGTTSGTFGISNDIGLFVEFMLAAGSDWQGTADSWNATQEYIASGAENALDTATNEFFVTGVKLEIGDMATPFVSRSYGEELALCQRYYVKTFRQEVVPAQNTNDFNGALRVYLNTGGDPSMTWNLPVALRKAPTGSTSGYPLIDEIQLYAASLSGTAHQWTNTGGSLANSRALQSSETVIGLDNTFVTAGSGGPWYIHVSADVEL